MMSSRCRFTQRILRVTITFVLILIFLVGQSTHALSQRTTTPTYNASTNTVTMLENSRESGSRTKSDDSIFQLLSNREFLLEAVRCISNVSLIGANDNDGVSYLQQLRVQNAGDGTSLSRIIRNELRVLHRHINSKHNVAGDRYRFVFLVLILRLFAVLKSCGKRFNLKDHRAPILNRRRRSAADQCFASLVHDLAPVICQMPSLKRRRRRRRRKRDIDKNRRQRHGQTQAYVDNAYQQALIANFIENSLADLKTPQSVVEEKHVAESTFRPSINVMVTKPGEGPSDWSLLTTTQIYPVPLKPQPYDRPELVTESLVHWSHVASNNDAYKPTESTHIVTESHWYRPKPPAWHPPPSLSPENVALHFPNPNKPSTDEFKQPVFVEPIVVSSVDQLPTNYPIPMENISLGHNPITVVVGSPPPEIVILEDTTFSAAMDDPVEQTTVAIQEDPAAAGGAAGSAIGPAVAAAAGLGALGAVGAAAGAAGIAGGAVAGGIGAGAAAAAGANAAAGGGAGADAEVAGSGSVGVALTPTDLTAYTPAADDDVETGLETAFTDVYGFFTWLLSFGFVRSLTTALYTLVLPHISFLLTSGFTAIAFMFPWLYPHIVVPLVDALSALPTFRSIDEER